MYNHIDEIWSIDLADKIDDKFLNHKGFRRIFIQVNQLPQIDSHLTAKSYVDKSIDER